jgi:NAD(P)-dependent dehydrogenase (short-subunit alcohol dehydrogenase family)
MTSVLITGTNRGLGFEFARQYAAGGVRVFAACRNPAAADALRQLEQTTEGRLSVIAMDVTDAKSVGNAAAQLKDLAIDVLINAAGIAGPSRQTTGNVDYKAWAEVLEVNTMGPLRVLESFMEHIACSERRLAVTITSGMGSLADNKSGGSIAYRSSKAAVTPIWLVQDRQSRPLSNGLGQRRQKFRSSIPRKTTSLASLHKLGRPS